MVGTTTESPPQTKVNGRPKVTQEEEDEEEATENAPLQLENDAAASLEQQPVVKKRRRSLRNTNRIVLSDRTSLQYRRLDELFFQEKRRTSPTTFQIGNLVLQRIHSSPNIYVIDNFLTSTELDYFHNKIETGKFQRSFVDDTANTLFDTQHRTSTFLSFGKQQDSRIASIEQRAATLLGCWTPQCVEPLQLVRYLPGQFFGAHHDMGDLQNDGSVNLPPKSLFCKRRLVTLFCYLNTVEQGGATLFPRAYNLRVAPRPGRAVLFSNINADGLADPRTVHAGQAVERGVKYGLNIWVCED